MPTHDSATRTRLSAWLHDLGSFSMDAARAVDHDQLGPIIERLAPGQPAPPGHGTQYEMLARHFAEVAVQIVLYCGQLKGGRTVAEEHRRADELQQARTVLPPTGGSVPAPPPVIPWGPQQGAGDPDMVARLEQFRSRRGMIPSTGAAITQHLGDTPPSDGALEGAAQANSHDA